ncbi:hydantoinase/oxoprolinase family protein [Gemmata sp. JC717]|uniref:hydantoinase/oxoprolinase family protein n=1 Tax=Gemmata algarum TaxID=2975278 RepID=UPI0021BA47E5|nr:hydantoinase/oxoprolinase family protein [Gemmata algarum]MDY3555998.1 hydantoinase/oxoprolinase family protein [Gemmata algarum]
MATTILGLDIGGANLKAATHDRRAVSVPFPLWKQPDKLPAALAGLVAKFPDADELAVTMTGELCDCFETKREGVHAIIKAVWFASAARPIRVWSTDGVFLNSEEAKASHMKVAAANWHALATFAGRFVPHYGALLLDIGSTTSDLIPLDHGVPSTYGTTDWDRLQMRELVYVGVRRTPVCAVMPDRTCAELFATTEDVYTILGLLPEEPENRETADGRPQTTEYALARLARMLGADREQLTDDHLIHFATRVHAEARRRLTEACRAVYYDQQSPPELHRVIVSGAGEFLARQVAQNAFPELGDRLLSLNDQLGPEVSACAPAYAVAVLATEVRP